MYRSKYRSTPLCGLYERLREPLVWLFVAVAGLMLCQTLLQRRPLKIKHAQDIHQRCPRKNRALPRRVSTYMQKTSASGSLSVRLCVLMGVISSALHHCIAIIWNFLTFAFEISWTGCVFFSEARPCALCWEPVAWCVVYGPWGLYWFPFRCLLMQKLTPGLPKITTTDPMHTTFSAEIKY